MERRAPAVISVFAALSWCLVASMVFVLLDGVRIKAMGELLDERVHLTCRNAMANYQRELYEAYGLLGIDEVYSEMGEDSQYVVESMLAKELEWEKELQRKNQAAHSTFTDRVDLLNYPSIEVTEGSYQLLSDGNGQVFLKQAAAYMTALLPEQTVEKLLGEYSDHQNFRQQNDTEGIYDAARSALQVAGEILKQSQEGEEDGSDYELESVVMSEAEVRRKDPILELVLPNGEVSPAYMDIAQCPSNRTLQRGTIAAESVSVQEKLLGLCYCSRMFSDYLSGKGQQRSENCYQMEYLIVGEASDRENLSGVCSRLLAIREAVEFSVYYSDPYQRARAYTEAMALVGFTGNPALVEAVQLGFLAAWSLEDAIRDVQLLLEGKKVSFLGTAGSPQYGYRDYLKLLLFLTSAQQMAMRSLDLIEHHVNHRLKEGSFRVDHTITAIRGTAQAQIPWIFANLITVPIDSRKGCQKTIQWKEDYSGHEDHAF